MTRKVEELKDADLDNATGAGDSRHSKWIHVQSMSQATTGNRYKEAPEVSLNYEEIKVT